MTEKYRKDWQGLYQRHEAWWKFENSDRPLMWIQAAKASEDSLMEDPGPEPGLTEYEDGELNVDRINAWTRNAAEHTEYLAESFPCASVSFGPGAIATFLGCKPHYTKETVWYEPIFREPQDLRSLKACFDTPFWKHAEKRIPALKKLAGEDYLVCMPDLIDSMDTAASLMGTESLLYALIDDPDSIKVGLERLDDIYFDYFETCRNYLANDDGRMTVQSFSVLGRRVEKLQCDFCAMISREMFDEFVAPSLRKYCKRLDHAMYHIDGEDEMRHVDTMLEIEGLDAFQWIPKGFTTGTLMTDPSFYPMFDKIHEAGKGLYLSIYRGGPDDWAEETQKLIHRYGNRGMYFLYPTFPDVETAERFIARFEK